MKDSFISADYYSMPSDSNKNETLLNGYPTTNSLPKVSKDFANCVITTNSGTSVSGVTSWTKPQITLQKSDGNWITVDDIITKQDFNSTAFLWESLFLAICAENPKEAPEYMTMLKLYNEDYKQTVLAVELKKNKED